MGKIMEKKRKKKGRPSLLDIQKRNLKLQQQQQEEELRQKQEQQLKLLKRNSRNPNPNTPLRRSARRNPNFDHDNSTEDDGDDNGEEKDDQSARKRREKKLRLVQNLPNSSANSALSSSGSDLEGEDDKTPLATHKRRKIEAIEDGSGKKVERKGASTNQANIRPEIDLDDGSLTPLPDKKLLLFVLDRLQKKDTYGVFAEPVDPEELPDYHEVIEHPMDFSTIRKNLTDGLYKSLEHFERDIFLLCSNAMQYNAPDTIYFRQARAIQELAQKNFDNLRQDSDDSEPGPELKVVRRGRPPTKNVKKLAGRPSIERADLDHPETTTVIGGENHSNLDLRKVNNYDKYVSPDLSGRVSYNSRLGEVYINWSAEKSDRHFGNFGSTSKAISVKHGKKQVILDENRRNTYRILGSATVGQDSSVFSTFHGERKQLVPVGIYSQYGYARSLAIFAAKLGPAAWKVASMKIKRCLPPGVNFGPGWVGENDVNMKRHLDSTTCSTSTTTTCPLGLIPLDNSLVSVPTSVERVITPEKPDNRSSTVANSSVATDSTTASPVVTNAPHKLTSGVHHRPNPVDSTRCVQAHSISSSLQPCVNGVNGFNVPASLGKLLGPTRPSISGFNAQFNLTVSATSSGTESGHGRMFDAETNDSGATTMLGENPIAITQKYEGGSNCSPINSGLDRRPSGLRSESSDHDVSELAPPDLNLGFKSPVSPGSQLCAKSVQPDLALQL